MTDGDDDTETAEIVWTQDEGTFVEYILTTAEEDETDVYELTDLIEDQMGARVIFHGGTEEFHDDPPTPDDLLAKLQGQRMELTRTEVEALQTTISTYVFVMSKQGEPPTDLIGLIEEVHEKIRHAYDEVTPDDRYDDPESMW